MMESHQILDLMGELKLTGMRHAYAELVANAINRQLPVQHVIIDLLKAEMNPRSIKYQMTASGCRWPKRSTRSSSAGRQSMRAWYAILPLARSSPAKATSCWSAEPVQANRISTSP